MPVLLLCRGDVASRNLLKKAIEARYGVLPPAIEALHLTLKGRAHVQVGPFLSWAHLDMIAQFKFPYQARWDYVKKLRGVPVNNGAEALDQTIVHQHKGGTPTTTESPDVVASMRRRVWAAAALLLTPLGEMHVEVHAPSDNRIDATNTQTGDTVSLHLNNSHQLARVEIQALNLTLKTEQRFSLEPSDGQTNINGLTLPGKIIAAWEDSPFAEMEVVTADANPQFADTTFTL